MTEPATLDRPAPPTIHHVRQGSGSPLLLVHGVGHHGRGFTPVVGRLAAGGYETVRLDLPGFGASPPLAGDDHSIPRYADALEAWIGAQEFGRPAIVGNSMGGAIAIELARRGAVSRAVAVSPAGFWTDGERRWCQRVITVAAAIPRPLRPAILRRVDSPVARLALMSAFFSRPGRVPPDEARADLENIWRSPALAACLRDFDLYRFDPAGARIEVPLSVLWGSRDVLLPYGLQALRARRELPDARHVTLPGLGHTPFWDDPGMVARVILGVLGDPVAALPA